MTSSASQSMLGAVYAADLRELGAVDFRQWLLNCYSGPEPKLIGPHFIDEELEYQPFGDVFAKVIPELSDEERAIACEGAKHALNSFKKDNSTYEGLYNLARLAEALQVEDAAGSIFGILSAAFDTGSADPRDYSEAYYLRETLEVLFRLTALSPAAPSDKDAICAWAFRLATEPHHAKKLKFALAPLYVMGRLHALNAAPSHAKEQSWVYRLDASLLDGFKDESDLFKRFYVFEWQGEIFPFDVERLLGEIQTWLAARKLSEAEGIDAGTTLVRVVSLGDRYVRPLPLGEDGPISATSGRLGSPPTTPPDRVLVAREGQIAW